MTALWTTGDLPGAAFDPEPDDDGDAPWFPDLGGQGLDIIRLRTMTTIRPTGEYL